MRKLHVWAVAGYVSVGCVGTACTSEETDPSDGSGAAGTVGAANGSTGMNASASTGLPNVTKELTGDIATNTTLTADTLWILKGIVKVQAGVTLTIEAGTVIQGDKASLGTLVIKQGAKIMAEGTASEPIVFTSRLGAGQRKAGDWGGVILLGKAPINIPGGSASIEGLTTDELYGGTDAADSSGSMRYVRIEYGGVQLSADNEINGLTFGGVGSATTIENIMVKATLDDCFEWFGGTVNVKRLVCMHPGDDAFDVDFGYVGNMQFLFAKSDPSIADTSNGVEADNSADNPLATPITNPTIYNMTLCGQNAVVPKEQYGMLLRRGFHATISNAYVTGFEAGVDIRDAPATSVMLSHSVMSGNAPENVAYVEDGSNDAEQKNDDMMVDERAWFAGGAGNSEAAAALADCFSANPDPRPASTIPGATPPPGFEAAPYVGAFKDGSDSWMIGAWAEFSID